MFIISLIIAAVLVVADQLIKLAVVNNFELHEVKKFIPGVMSLTHIRNSGAAWSMMEGKTWFLIGMPVLIVAAALVFMYKNRNGHKLGMISMAMILGGGIGNLIDRVRMKEVVDYLNVEFFDFPVFNFADICVVVGAVLFCVYVLFFDESDKKDSKKELSKKEDNKNDAESEH